MDSEGSHSAKNENRQRGACLVVSHKIESKLKLQPKPKSESKSQSKLKSEFSQMLEVSKSGNDREVAILADPSRTRIIYHISVTFCRTQSFCHDAARTQLLTATVLVFA